MALKPKVGNIVAAFQSGALTRLANTNLPIKTASQLKQVLERAQESMKQYDEDRLAVCKQFGKLNEESGDYEFLNEEGELDTEAFEAFQTAGAELLQKELEFPGSPFGLRQFYSTHAITANDLLILDWLIAIETDVQATAASS